MEKKRKVICLYQVVMHYRVPFYQRLTDDEDFDFLLVYGNHKDGSKFKNTNFDTNKIHSKKLWNFFIGQFPVTPFLFFFLIKERPDVIFTEGSSSIFNSFTAFIYAKIFGKKIIWWSLGKVENRVQSKSRKIISSIEKFVERNVDAIFTYSTRGKDYFISRDVQEENIFVGVNVINDVSRLQETLNLKDNQKILADEVVNDKRFKICFIGTINKGKNIEILLDTIKSLNQQHRNLFVGVIVGDGGYLEELKKVYSQDAFFLGRINVGVVTLLKECDIMVLPGLGGLAICDGMLSRLPVITGIADGTEYDLIQHNENGFIEREMNTDILAERIMYYYKNPSIKENHGALSYRLITEKNSFNSYYMSWKLMYNYVINK